MSEKESKKPDCLFCLNSGRLDDGGSIVGCYHCGRDYRRMRSYGTTKNNELEKECDKK